MPRSNVPKFLARGEWRYYDVAEGLLDPPETAEELEEQFDELAQEIGKIIELACKKSDAMRATRATLPPMYTAKGILKQFVYHFGSHCLAENEEAFREVLINRIKDKGGRIVKSQGEFGGGNIFYLCFRALSFDLAPIKGGELSKLAKQLLHAFKCGIPPEYLIGFIYQTGGKRIAIVQSRSKHQNRVVEEDFDDDDDWD